MMTPLASRVAARWWARQAQPAGDLAGVRTFVSEKPAKGIQDSLGDTTTHPPGETPKSDRDRAKPQRTDTRENLERHPPGNGSFNTPGMAAPSGNPRPTVTPRTTGVPGEQYGHPSKDGISPRRTATIPPYSDRQHEQKGEAKRYYKQYYRQNKGEIRMEAERHYKKVRHSPSFKKERKQRRDPKTEKKFRRIPSGGYTTQAERSKEYRDKAAAAIARFWHPDLGDGTVLRVEDPWVLVEAEDGTYEIDFMDFVQEAVVDGPESLDAFIALADAGFDNEGPASAARVADFYREVYTKGNNLDPGEGVQDLGAPGPRAPIKKYPDRDDKKPTELMNDLGSVDNNPGSAKVIPEGHGFANKTAMRTAAASRVAMRMAEILQDLDPGIAQKALKIHPKLKRSDPANDMYTFSVPGSAGGSYLVRVKIVRKGNVVDPQKADLLLACTCDFWRWQGPEHHASSQGYLYGATQGTAASPRDKDPKGRHRVCKHARAVLAVVQKWTLGPVR